MRNLTRRTFASSMSANHSHVALWCGYEHGVVGAYLLPELLYGFGVSLILYVLIEVRYPAHIEALATYPLRSYLVRRPQDAAMEGGPPEAAGEAEYPEIFMLHYLYPVSLLDPGGVPSRTYARTI